VKRLFTFTLTSIYTLLICDFVKPRDYHIDLMGCILLCVEIHIPYIAVNMTLYIFPRRLQALFSKMHTLHVLAFLFKPSSGVIYIQVQV
jgi:hypothetical protein